MGKGKIEAMATKFSEKFAIIMLKKYRKFCRRGLTHLDATPIVQIHMRHPVDVWYLLLMMVLVKRPEKLVDNYSLSFFYLVKSITRYILYIGRYSVVSIKRTGSLNYFEGFYHPDCFFMY